MYYSVKDKLIHNRKVLESDMELKRFMEWFDEVYDRILVNGCSLLLVVI